MQVVLTPTHLAIVMEYAAGGELFERICSAGRFSEDEVVESFQYSFTNILRHHITYLLTFYGELFFTQARFFFQQLISGVSYCHSMVYTQIHLLCSL